MSCDELGHRHTPLDRVADECADRAVSVAEGDALLDEVLGQIGGRGVTGIGGRLHAVGAKLGAGEHAGHRSQAQGHLLDGVEERLLVLLQITVVSEGQALEGREQAGQITDEAAGLAPRQLGDVGILLLRQHRRARRVGVVEPYEPELIARPQHDLLADAGEVYGQQRESEERLGDEVAIGDGVEAVLEAGGEAQVGRSAVGVQGQRGAGQSPGTER